MSPDRLPGKRHDVFSAERMQINAFMQASRIFLNPRSPTDSPPGDKPVHANAAQRQIPALEQGLKHESVVSPDCTSAHRACRLAACAHAGRAIRSALRRCWMHPGAKSAIDCTGQRQQYFRRELRISPPCLPAGTKSRFHGVRGFNDVFALSRVKAGSTGATCNSR